MKKYIIPELSMKQALQSEAILMDVNGSVNWDIVPDED